MTTTLKKPTTKITVPKTYTALRANVRKVIRLGKMRAQKAVDREKVRTAWEVGKLTHNHILLKKDRANYGGQVIKKLSKDLGLGERELYSMVEFSRAYPNLTPASNLSWSHYRTLLRINDAELRNQFALTAEKEKWTRDDLRSEIKKLKSTSKTPTKKEILTPVKPGPLNVFRKRVVNTKTLIDLGFSTYLEKSHVKRKLKFVKDRNYTYQAEIESVVDGDTIWCVVDLGLGVKTRQKLRLAAINAPEVRSTAGQAAKRYLKRKLKPKTEIILTTTKSDKFDRYLADVWLNGKHVNQLLVNRGHARVVS